MRIPVIFFCLLSVLFPAQDFAKNVNPFIGTGGHGHTFPGATVPFGMVQLSPNTRIDGSWDGCSGYHYSDTVIYGFSHTHLNWTGVSDYGDIMLMPMMGKASLNNKIYSSKFSHKNENAEAGFYQVKLLDDQIDVRLTTTKRVGYHENTFPKTGEAHLILDLNHRDELLEGEVRVVDDKTLEVFRRSKAWAQDQYVFARIELSKPFKISLSEADSKEKNSKIFKGKKLKIALTSAVKKGEKVLVKVALSPTSYDGAKLNMLAEAKPDSFDEIRAQATELWNSELSKIEVKSSDQDKLSIFYTALYHLFIQPNIYQDVDGKYRGRDNQIHQADHDYYTVFSLWDTFRGAHPLMTLIDRKRTADFINTFIKQYEQGGRLPVWELAANETDCMIGYHSVSVIADAMAKGIKGFDYEKAYAAAKNSAMLDIFGLNAYKKQHFISAEDEHESVSKTLEYAYDDWCIAQMAKMLNKKQDYEYFMLRSQSWKNLYNPKNGYMQPRSNGDFLTPFDPREVNNHFTEGNSWQYSFFVPQDVPGLIALHGGKQNFEKFLDELFADPEKTTGREQVDITGLIGQYAHGNEPSHHIAYLYNYVDKPEKTNEKVRFILDNFYKNSPDGLIGNEDCGQMSAWYVLSSLGIYSVTPGKAEWSTTTPYFDEVKINLEDGSSRIITKTTSAANLKKLGFENIATVSAGKYAELLPAPLIRASRSFELQNTVEIEALHPDDKIFYTLIDRSNPEAKQKFQRYRKPFTITQSTTVLAYAERKGAKSSTVTGQFFKKPNFWNIDVHSSPHPQYTAGGNAALIDGITATENWRKGDWTGFQGQDFEAVIDFKKIMQIKEISVNFLQDSRSWILLPKKIEYYLSSDNKDFFLIATEEHQISPQDEQVNVHRFKTEIVPTDARYLKIKATNFGKLPNWHQGAGNDAYIFVDEIEVK